MSSLRSLSHSKKQFIILLFLSEMSSRFLLSDFISKKSFKMRLSRSQVALIHISLKKILGKHDILMQLFFFFCSFGMWEFLVHKLSKSITCVVTEDSKQTSHSLARHCMYVCSYWKSSTFSPRSSYWTSMDTNPPPSFPCGRGTCPTLGEFLTHPPRRTCGVSPPSADHAGSVTLRTFMFVYWALMCLGTVQTGRDTAVSYTDQNVKGSCEKGITFINKSNSGCYHWARKAPGKTGFPTPQRPPFLFQKLKLSVSYP